MRDATLKNRFFELDVYRGIAIAMMILFHFLYDLNTYHFTRLPLFTHAFWRVYREGISFLFLTLVGFCLYMEHRHGIRWKQFWVRFIKLGTAALFVTIGTYLYAPNKQIMFGILHFIAVGSLAALPFLHTKRLNFLLAGIILATGYIGFIHEAHYRIPGLEWIGFGAATIPTLEIFPFIPFFGYILLGMGIAQTVFTETPQPYLLCEVPQNALTKPLGFIGRHPLIIYLVHQTLLVGIISRLAQ